MITEQDLQEAIAECQGERNPNANTCIKLAAFYTIRNELFGNHFADPGNMYSYAADAPTNAVQIDSDSDFASVVNGRTPAEIWPIIDELVSTLRVVNPRLYASLMRKLQ